MSDPYPDEVDRGLAWPSSAISTTKPRMRSNGSAARSCIRGASPNRANCDILDLTVKQRSRDTHGSGCLARNDVVNLRRMVTYGDGKIERPQPLQLCSNQ